MRRHYLAIASALVTALLHVASTPALAQLSAAPANCDAASCSAMRLCSAQELDEIRRPATDSVDSVRVKCSATLTPGDTITRRLEFGPEASGATFDCNGATIANPATGSKPGDTYRVTIRSNAFKQTAQSDRPRDITIKNCVVRAAIGVNNGISQEQWRQSSFELGHARRMQEWAPTRIRFTNLAIEASPLANGQLIGNLVYLSAGSTRVTIEGSRLTGTITGTPIYLDAESANNAIRDNSISVTTTVREQIAIDGSSDNVIAGNVFTNPAHGAIYVYRNCGEHGIVRHNEPRRNTIRANSFLFNRPPSVVRNIIWIGSRNHATGSKTWCQLDDGHKFGSSVDDRDIARQNRIIGNRFSNIPRNKAILIDDMDNIERGTVIRPGGFRPHVLRGPGQTRQ